MASWSQFWSHLLSPRHRRGRQRGAEVGDRGVLSLYGSPSGEAPILEIRIKRMCRTPPYNRAEMRARLVTGLKSLGIPRFDVEDALADKRPNIPLEELSGGRAERLLSLVGRWIDEFRAHVSDPEPAGES